MVSFDKVVMWLCGRTGGENETVHSRHAETASTQWTTYHSRIPLAGSCLAILLALSGCGGEPEKPSPQTSTPETSESSETAGAAADSFENDLAANTDSNATTSTDSNRLGKNSSRLQSANSATGSPLQLQPGAAYEDEGELDPRRRESGFSAGASPSESELAEDVTRWKPEDYFTAKKERNRLLLDAVEYAGQKPEWFSSAKLVQTFVKLLNTDEPDTPPQPEEAQQADTTAPPGVANGGEEGREGGEMGFEEGFGERRGGFDGQFGDRGADQTPATQVEPQVAKAIIAALGANETDLALKTLEALLVGEQQAPLEVHEIVPETAKAIGFKTSPRREDLLFRLITKPELVKLPPQEEPDATNPDPREARGRRGPSFGEEEEGMGFRGRFAPRGGGRGRPGGPIDAVWVQEQIVTEAGPNFSAALRTRLAKHLENPQVTVETAQLLEPLLSENDPRNLVAQVHLYSNSATEEQARRQIEEQLLHGSGQALTLALGLPLALEDSEQGFSRGGFGGRGSRGRGFGGAIPGMGMEEDGEEGFSSGRFSPPSRGSRKGGASSRPSERGRPSSPDRSPTSGRPSRRPSPAENAPADEEPESPDLEKIKQETEERVVSLASALWTAKLATALSSTIPNNDLVRNQWESRGTQLAATIPISETRSLLKAQFLETEEQEEDDPGSERDERGFESSKSPRDFSNLFGSPSVDPALLVLAKSVYHQRKPYRSSRTRNTRGGSAGGADPSTDPRQQEWVSTVEPLVSRLCERFSQSHPSQPPPSKAVEENSPTEPTELESMPVRLHKDANVVSQHHVRWPDKIDPRLAHLKIAPLELHYVRIEEEGHPDRLQKIYERQAGRSEPRSFGGGVWLDGFDSSDSQSIDIRIMAQGAGGFGGARGPSRGFGEEEGFSPSRGGAPQRGRATNDKPEPVPVVIEILTISIAEPPEKN